MKGGEAEQSVDEWVRCRNCQFPMGCGDREQGARYCSECVETYAISDWENAS